MEIPDQRGERLRIARALEVALGERKTILPRSRFEKVLLGLTLLIFRIPCYVRYRR